MQGYFLFSRSTPKASHSSLKTTKASTSSEETAFWASFAVILIAQISMGVYNSIFLTNAKRPWRIMGVRHLQPITLKNEFLAMKSWFLMTFLIPNWAKWHWLSPETRAGTRSTWIWVSIIFGADAKDANFSLELAAQTISANFATEKIKRRVTTLMTMWPGVRAQTSPRLAMYKWASSRARQAIRIINYSITVQRLNAWTQRYLSYFHFWLKDEY